MTWKPALYRHARLALCAPAMLKMAKPDLSDRAVCAGGNVRSLCLSNAMARPKILIFSTDALTGP